MKKHIFWRLFNAVVLTTVVLNSTGLEVYGWNDPNSGGGTLLDVFRGRGPNPAPPAVSAPTPTGANYETYSVPAPQVTTVPAAPQMTAVPAPQMTTVPAPQVTTIPAAPQNGFVQPVEGGTRFPNGQYVPPSAPMPQPAGQNKWSLRNLFNGTASNQPQYVGTAPPAPPLAPSPAPVPAYNTPHSHAPQSIMANGPTPQYRVVPLDSEEFQPQEGAIYNEKGEMIYSPESGGVMPNGAEGEMAYGVNGGEVLYDNNGPAPYVESGPGVRRVITGNQSGAGRTPTPVNQERVYSNAPGNQGPSPMPMSMPAPMPVNPYAQQPAAGLESPPVGTRNPAVTRENPGALNLNSGATAFSKTYKPGPALTSVPTEPVMDIATPELAEALPQEGNREPGTGYKQITGHSPSRSSTPNPAIGAAAPTASPVIEELPNASPLENLSENRNETPALEPVPESVPEIDVPKEPVADRRQETMKGGNEVSEGAEPRGRVDEVLLPKKSVSALPTSNQEPTLSGGITHSPTGERANSQPQAGSSDSPSATSTPLATRSTQSATPLIIEIAGPEEVEFGKNEMFSLSVINTTDAIRRDVVLSVHPEGFGNDKTASITLEQLAPNEKKSVYMKLNARQYNNLSLTAHVRDALGFETTKTINVNVKNESVKISILPPQAGNAYVGQPTHYIVRIVNKADRDVSLNAMAFFGNGIEPIRASGAPNTIQSGQVVVNEPIELKQGEMRDLKIIAVAFQPGVHKILVQLIDSRGETYAAKESCAYRQREFDNDDSDTAENDARIELTPGKSEIGVWKPASAPVNQAVGSNEGNSQEAVGSSNLPETNLTPLATRNSQLATPDAPALNSPDSVPLTQPDQGPKADLIMPMFAQ